MMIFIYGIILWIFSLSLSVTVPNCSFDDDFHIWYLFVNNLFVAFWCCQIAAITLVEFEQYAISHIVLSNSDYSSTIVLQHRGIWRNHHFPQSAIDNTAALSIVILFFFSSWKKNIHVIVIVHKSIIILSLKSSVAPFESSGNFMVGDWTNLKT